MVDIIVEVTIFKMKIGKFSIWFGKTPLWGWLPWISIFNGGCYRKVGLLWLNYLLELSWTSKTNTLYKCRQITKEEADQLFGGDKYYD